MTKTSFLERVHTGQILVSDGATGTNLQQRGLAAGKAGESWVVERPEEILRLHRDFIAAGSDIILTCTFGGTSIRLAQDGWGGRAVEINQKAAALALEAVQDTDVLVAGSMGPTGQMLKPLGTMEETDCFNAYQQQAKALAEAGVDLLLVETQYDLGEAGLAVKAARSVSNLPLVCSFSYDRGKRTMMGVKPAQMAQTFADTVDVLGINCGRSLEDNLAALVELRAASTLPIWFKPNAGLPQVDADGRTTFNVTPEGMGDQVVNWIAAGASVVGGCCGSSPEHIRRIARAVGK
ncbi:MAG: homocysteine S-methyltransferase family protein [Chloroflexi bacterium]|nr:homocysteine S-methyltransferase family protein [Chloroflexota bacterium]